MVLSSISLIFLISSQALGFQWQMNDVTLLYPLPKDSEEVELLLSPKNQGQLGQLIPEKFYDLMPEINQGEPKGHTYQSLRAVAVRIDPCFDEDLGDCLQQVRIIWQPIGEATYGSRDPKGIESKDAALHTFHTLSGKEFKELTSQYAELIQKQKMSTNGPLRIHPILQTQGLNGAFSKDLKKLLLQYAGEKNLWRMTSMKTGVGVDQWEFSGVNIRNGQAEPIRIARLNGAENQIFSVSTLRETEFFNGQMAPAISEDTDRLDSILKFTSNLRRMNNEQVSLLTKTVARIENPKIHSPNTMDCLTCHASQVAGSMLMRERKVQLIEDVFKSPNSHDMSQTGRRLDQSNVLRAIGYFEKDPIISRRIINESAAVADAMNAKYSRQ